MQNITPCLMFNNQAEEAVNFYVSVFKNSKLGNVTRFSEEDIKELSRIPEDTRPGPAGVVRTAAFQLNGQEFIAGNGGPYFKFTPAFSFFVSCKTEAEVERLFSILSDGGQILMPLDKYPFSEKFAWVQDKYDVSWQLILSGDSQKITPFLMFVGEQYGKAEEAIKFYTSLFKESAINGIGRYGKENPQEEGKVVHASFLLNGQEIMAMESGLEHHFTFTEALSLYVSCDTQEEIDYLWEKLSEGGEKQQCGWLKDKYGVSWQIVPAIVWQLINDPDPVKSQKVVSAVYKMKKLDVNKIQEVLGY